MRKLPKNPMPENLKGCFLAGGAILSTVTKTEISDYDIYPKSKESMIDIFRVLEESNCFVVNVTDNAVSFKSNSLIRDNGERMIIQVMTFSEFKTPEDIFNFFDFSVCMGAFDADTEQYHFHPDFWPDVASKTLTFNVGTRYPLNSLIRSNKYTRRGYTLPKTESVKLALAIAKIGMPTCWKDLERAIGGAYGRELVFRSKDVEFSYEAAIEMLDEMATYSDLSLLMTSMEDHKISADHLELLYSDTKPVFFEIPVNDYSHTKFLYEDGVFKRFDSRIVDLLNMKYELLSPETEIFGYKILRESDDEGVYENKIFRKVLKYRLGEHTVEETSPHIHVYPISRKIQKNSDTDRICKFSFLAKDIKKMSDFEYNVSKVKMVEILKGDQT